MSLFRSTTVVVALLALGATAAAAQSRRAAPIWSIPLPDRDVRWESRNGDSDSDSDSDWDSDSDDRRARGSIWDRVDPRNRLPGRRAPDRRDRDERGNRGGVLEREMERAHDAWHRRNDRYRNDREYRRRHEELHEQLARARRQAGVSRRGGVIR